MSHTGNITDSYSYGCIVILFAYRIVTKNEPTTIANTIIPFSTFQKYYPLFLFYLPIYSHILFFMLFVSGFDIQRNVDLMHILL